MKKSILHATLLLLLTGSLSGYSQNIGVGVANPQDARFECHGLVGNTAAIFGGNSTGIGIIGNWPEIGYNAYYNNGTRYIANGAGFIQLLDPGSGYMSFDIFPGGTKDAVATSSIRAFSILPSGRISVGPNAGGNATLNVGRSPGMTATAYFAGSHFSAFNYSSSEHTILRNPNFPIYFNPFSQNSKVVMGNGSTRVGINWTIPTYPLEIHNYGIYLSRTQSPNRWWLITLQSGNLAVNFRADATGNFVTKGVFESTSGYYSALSDARLKTGIRTLAPALEKLRALRPVSYQMLHNNPKHLPTFGLIAQELKMLYPELVHVTQNSNAGYDGIQDLHMINYSGLAPVVVKALQEQHQQLSDIEKRIEQLERKR